jgi:hypothetical protein
MVSIQVAEPKIDTTAERPLRYHRTTGLRLTQMQELVLRVRNALTEPWNEKVGRPKSCGLYEAVQTACMYLRQNSPQEFLGDLREVSQPTISRYVAALMPVIETVLKEFVPTAKEAIEVVNGKACLVDDTIALCWSYADHEELWSRKKGTTGRRFVRRSGGSCPPQGFGPICTPRGRSQVKG